jgi:glucose-1-phosphate adenylyltransferase
MRLGETWYRGTADAVTQNLNLIRDFDPDYVVVFGADHIYRMDISCMLAYHIKQKADATIATLPVPIEKAKGFGIVEANETGRVMGFEEKPKKPSPMPGNTRLCYSSMGNYIFNRDVLEKALAENARRIHSAHDFGKNIIPALYKKAKVYAYNFQAAELPGQKSYEEKGYWRDVGTLEAYWSSQMDLLGEKPLFDLNNSQWPIAAGKFNGPSAQIFGGQVKNSILSEGSVIHDKAQVNQSVLGRGVILHPGAVVEDSVLMDFCEVGPNAHLKRVVADRFNIFTQNTRIGYDSTKDAQAGYHVDKSGLVAVAKSHSHSSKS